MSGLDAVKELLDAVKREEVIDVGLVARALGLSKRQVIRDWRRRKHPFTQVGREVLLPSQLALRIYFPHRISGN